MFHYCGHCDYKSTRSYHYCGHCDFKSTRSYILLRHMDRRHAALEDDEDKKGEIDVLNGEGMKQDEMKLHQESIDVFKIYKLLQRMKNK